jgi:general secretion pathway protein B
MSYILEALRRAESERERKRGGVPGLHANPVPMPSPDEMGERRGKPWVWVASGLSIGVLLMILWRWWSVEPLIDEGALARAPVGGNVSQNSADAPAAALPAPPAPVPAPPPAQPAPAPQTAPAPAPGPKAAASGTADKPPRTTRPAPPPRSTATAAAPRETQSAPPPQAGVPAQGPAQGPAPAPQPPPAAPPPERVRTLAELPDDLRRSLPQLAFGGSVYSDTPAQRMVILNGQVMREGDAVTDELQIEQIRPRSAVLRMRGQRFEMPF